MEIVRRELSGRIVWVFLLTLIAVTITAGCSSTTHVYQTNASDPHGCPAGYMYCSYRCTFLQNDTWNCGKCGNVCPIGGTCTRGKCHCEKGKTNCNNECVDLQTDLFDCGSCGNGCSSSEECKDGECWEKY